MVLTLLTLIRSQEAAGEAAVCTTHPGADPGQGGLQNGRYKVLIKVRNSSRNEILRQAMGQPVGEGGNGRQKSRGRNSVPEVLSGGEGVVMSAHVLSRRSERERWQVA